LALVAARPSHGKSAFALQWADAVAAQGVPVLFISEEMGAIALGKRNLQSYAPLLEEHFDETVAPTLRAKLQEHWQCRRDVFIAQNCYTIDRAEEVIDQHVALNNVGAVVVDYAQLLRSRSGAARNENVADVSIRLRQATTRNGVAMLCCAQLNRELEYRKDRIPKMSDLGDSGQLERDADVILVLDRPGLYDSVNARENDFAIHVLKRRNGAIRERLVKATFYLKSQTIGSYAPEARE
jgi:replicative DNA helicase